MGFQKGVIYPPKYMCRQISSMTTDRISRDKSIEIRAMRSSKATQFSGDIINLPVVMNAFLKIMTENPKDL
jgi:hypothetical protein